MTALEIDRPPSAKTFHVLLGTLFLISCFVPWIHHRLLYKPLDSITYSYGMHPVHLLVLNQVGQLTYWLPFIIGLVWVAACGFPAVRNSKVLLVVALAVVGSLCLYILAVVGVFQIELMLMRGAE